MPVFGFKTFFKHGGENISSVLNEGNEVPSSWRPTISNDLNSYQSTSKVFIWSFGSTVGPCKQFILLKLENIIFLFSFSSSDSIFGITIWNAKEGRSKFNFWNAWYQEKYCQIAFLKCFLRKPFWYRNIHISFLRFLHCLMTQYIYIKPALLFYFIKARSVMQKQEICRIIYAERKATMLSIIPNFENSQYIRDIVSISDKGFDRQFLDDIHQHGFLYSLRTEILLNKTCTETWFEI